MPRILLVIGIPNFDYQNKNSAVLAFVRQIKEAIEKEGHKVDFLNEDKIDLQTNRQAPVQSKNKKLTILKKVLKKWPWFYYSLTFNRYFKMQDRLSKRASKVEKYDRIIEFYTVGSTVGKDLAEAWKVPLSIIFDAPTATQFYEMHHTYSIYKKRIVNAEGSTLRSADKIIAYSPACKQYIVDQYHINGAVHILPSILFKETKQNKESGSLFNIGFIGSFLNWHKVDLLVKVFAKFNAVYSLSKLTLIGYGEEWSKVKELVDSLDLNERVEMPGFVSEKELNHYKSEFTVGVMAGSNWYGSPLKLFEYAFASIPFIAPESKTVLSIFKEHEHCLFVKENDEENSLYKALETYYLNEDIRVKLGKEVKGYVSQNYSYSLYQTRLNKFLIG